MNCLCLSYFIPSISNLSLSDLIFFSSYFTRNFQLFISRSLVVCSDAFHDKNGDFHLNMNDSKVIRLKAVTHYFFVIILILVFVVS